MIDWPRLFEEFSRYRPPESMTAYDFRLFSQSLVRPEPAFVERFFAQRPELIDPDRRAALLYFFLLDKRYDEKLNLLHFAFHIFDEQTHLPDEIIAQTPFPHEDGVPNFRHFGDSDYSVL